MPQMWMLDPYSPLPHLASCGTRFPSSLPLLLGPFSVDRHPHLLAQGGGAGLRKRTSAGWLSLESVRVPCGAGGAGALPRRPAHTLVYFRLRSRGREVACESPGNICWVSCTRGLPQRVTGVCWPVVRLPGPPAVLPPASPGWSGGSGHRLDGGSAGPADRATASTPSGRRHEAPAVLLPRGSGAGLWPRLQAAGHPHG